MILLFCFLVMVSGFGLGPGLLVCWAASGLFGLLLYILKTTKLADLDILAFDF